MHTLPLFPLNTVLFPGMPIYLHIFEERYKIMINRCIEFRQPFGVVLMADENFKSPKNQKPHLIGCTAQITQVQPLDQGRLNIAAMGVERFKIIALDYSEPYLMGNIALYPITSNSTDIIQTTAKKLRARARQYIEILKKTQQFDINISNFPDNDTLFAYSAAALLKISSQHKQTLLEMEDIEQLLTSLHSIYQYEMQFAAILLSPPIDDGFYGTFSLS